MLKKITQTAIAATALTFAYAYFSLAKGNLGVLEKLLNSAFSILPWALLIFVVHNTKRLTPVALSWCAVIVGLFTAEVEFECGAGYNCGWMFGICWIMAWLSAFFAAMFSSKKKL